MRMIRLKPWVVGIRQVFRLLLVFPALAAPTYAQESRRPSETVEAYGGWMHDFRGNTEDAVYYQLLYRGKQVRTKGSPFKELESLQVSTAKLHDPSGDSEDITLRLERGSVSSDNPDFEILGVQPLPLSIPSLARLRGSALITGDVNAEQLNVAIGLESPPFHPLRELNKRTALNVTNWIIAGVQAERRKRGEEVTGLDESGVFQARAFFGRGFFWKYSKRLGGVNHDLVRDVLALAPNFQTAIGLMPAIKERIRSNEVTPPERLIEIIAEEGTNLSEEQKADSNLWEAKVTEAALEDEEHVPPDVPILLFWLEGAVWRQFGQERETDSWLNNVLLTMRLAPFPRMADAFWLSIQYVNGYERTNVTERRDLLVVSAAMKL